MWMQRAYLLQYTALMMIVLLMTLASHAGNSRKRAKQESLPAINQSLITAHDSVALLSMSDIFVRNKSALVPARAKALAHLLKQHDLKGRIEISASRKDSFSLAMLRARSLTHYLSSQNIPLDEIHVLAHSRPQSPGAQLKFFAGAYK